MSSPASVPHFLNQDPDATIKPSSIEVVMMRMRMMMDLFAHTGVSEETCLEFWTLLYGCKHSDKKCCISCFVFLQGLTIEKMFECPPTTFRNSCPHTEWLPSSYIVPWSSQQLLGDCQTCVLPSTHGPLLPTTSLLFRWLTGWPSESCWAGHQLWTCTLANIYFSVRSLCCSRFLFMTNQEHKRKVFHDLFLIYRKKTCLV